MGWPQDQIQVIEDIGQGGTSQEERSSMTELMSTVGDGQVGLVLIVDMTRLTRTSNLIQQSGQTFTSTNTLLLIGTPENYTI